MREVDRSGKEKKKNRMYYFIVKMLATEKKLFYSRGPEKEWSRYRPIAYAVAPR